MPPYVRAVISWLAAIASAVMTGVAWGGPTACKLWAGAPAWICSPEAFSAESLLPRAVTLFSLLVGLFNTYLWRTQIGRWLGWPIPDLRGTWRGVLTPGIAPVGQDLAPPSPVYLVVYQTAFRFRAFLYTAESRSQSLAAEFTQTDDELELVYSYRNEPRQNVQQDSPIHLGTAKLLMRPRSPDCLSGLYFTQRMTRGEMSFDGHSREHAQDYMQASRGLTYKERELPCDS